jgi:hypothetical protein
MLLSIDDLSGLPTDVGGCILAFLPARVVRQVSRSARDASDGAAEALELAWRTSHRGDDRDRRSLCAMSSSDALCAMLAADDRFARVADLSFDDDARGDAVHVVLLALLLRPRPLRRLSIASACYVPTADLCPTLAALPRPLERLRLSLPGLCCRTGGDVAAPAEQLAGSLRAMAGGLRDLSLGQLDPRALPAVLGAVVAMSALESLELRAPMPSSAMVRALVAALAAAPGPRLGRLETLSLTAGCGLGFLLQATDAPRQLGAALAALPALRSLTVDSFVDHGAPLGPALGAALGALTSLTLTHYSVHASDLALLTGLRSLRAASISAEAAEDLADAALGALAGLTALTRLELFNNQALLFNQERINGAAARWTPRPPRDSGRPLPPSLRALQAGQCFAPLLLEAGALTELTCCAFWDLEGKSAAAFEAQLNRRLATQTLTSLSVDDLPWAHEADDLRIGLPCELGALTRLEASARMLLRPRPLARVWPWLQALFRPDGPDGRRGPGTSRLRHLVVRRCGRRDVAPMLRDLPALTTLELHGLMAGSRASRALSAAFGELPALRELRLSGDELAIAEALEAAATAPALRARLERVEVDMCWLGTLLSADALDRFSARVRPFAALRSLRVTPTSAASYNNDM